MSENEVLEHAAIIQIWIHFAIRHKPMSTSWLSREKIEENRMLITTREDRLRCIIHLVDVQGDLGFSGLTMNKVLKEVLLFDASYLVVNVSAFQ